MLTEIDADDDAGYDDGHRNDNSVDKNLDDQPGRPKLSTNFDNNLAKVSNLYQISKTRIAYSIST